MSKRQKKKTKVGLSPGTLIYTGEKAGDPVRLTLFEYGEDHFKEREVSLQEACFDFRQRKDTAWLNIDGIHDVSVIEQIGAHFGIHALVLEDILDIQHRPKKEEHSEYIFVSLSMLTPGQPGNAMQHEHVSIILGRNFIITFQEDKEGDAFDPVRERLRSGKGKLRKHGADYLAYALIDVVVDHYFAVLESMGERYELLEERLLEKQSPAILHEITKAKREMLHFRRCVWPVRDIVTSLVRDDSHLIGGGMVVYLRDLYDHVVEVIEIAEMLRDLVGVMIELYLTNVSNRTNEIMKVLALISTIFMPLTFIAGIYGMNFDHMPELRWQYGYYMALAVMAGIGGVLILLFRRRGWM